MSHRRPLGAGLALLMLLVVPSMPLAAQGPQIVKLPWESQAASVSQTIGMTELSVSYHRPAVKGRKVWGALVPFDTVWRAGANQNTVFASTSPFSAGGHALPAGRYGIHMIPTATTWTVIFSREAGAWGAFSYRESEDALRLTVTPSAGDFTEHLQYTFDEPTDSAVTLTLHWEKLAVAIPLSVPVNQVVMDTLRQQYRDLPRFFPMAWIEGARWALQHNTELDVAEAWADSALQIQPSFAGMRLKAALQERRGNTAGAAALREQAMGLATEPDVNAVAYQLMGQGKMDEAMTLFRKNVKDYPRSWNVYDSLGEALAKQGNKKEALANYQKALSLAPEAQKARITGIIAGLR
jgi:tetratricopeptide (TPR) repeat protein